MHLGLGITFHLIAIFNGCATIYFYTLIKRKYRVVKVAIGLSVISIFVGLYGLFWDLVWNASYNYYDDPESTNTFYVVFELIVILLTMLFSLMIVYHDDYGLIKKNNLNEKDHNNVVALVAVELVFISYITIIMVYKMLQNLNLMD
jgi:hypothetical protein